MSFVYKGFGLTTLYGVLANNVVFDVGYNYYGVLVNNYEAFLCTAFVNNYAWGLE